jgi:hypothetical protein
MPAQKLPEFGTGLRAALERRGTLGSAPARILTLTLLAREPEDVSSRELFAAPARLAAAA